MDFLNGDSDISGEQLRFILTLLFINIVCRADIFHGVINTLTPIGIVAYDDVKISQLSFSNAKINHYFKAQITTISIFYGVRVIALNRYPHHSKLPLDKMALLFSKYIESSRVAFF